jgi:uncharacterized protein (UPF0276 family)
MFLTVPTIEELKQLDMPVLLDMLAYQTNLYLQLMRSVAVENTIQNCKESIINIQAVIQMRKNLENSSTNTSSRISFTQDSAE